MRLVCHLREIRGERTMKEIEAMSGVGEATLSRLERGQLLPSDDTLEQLAVAYGRPLLDWYEWVPPTGVQLRADA